MEDRRPPLVIVSGAPATGKTTLASRLADELQLPVLSKDLIKETLLDALGPPGIDLEGSRRVGMASYAVLHAVVGRLVDAGVGVIVESNFSRGQSEGELRPLAARTRAVLIHCETSATEVVRRYTERDQRGERHPGHFDTEALPDVVRNLAAGRYEPLALGVPLLRVDTSVGYTPGWDAIRAFASRQTSPDRAGNRQMAPGTFDILSECD